MDYYNYYNTALRKDELPGGSFGGVGKEGTHQAGHVALLFSANQIRGLKSGRQIIEVRLIENYPNASKLPINYHFLHTNLLITAPSTNKLQVIYAI